jgi:transposase
LAEAATQRYPLTIAIEATAFGGFSIPQSATTRLMLVAFRRARRLKRKEQLKFDPFSGVVFSFHAKRADRVKLIFWDGTGLCLFAKRLEGGKFRWPRLEDGVKRLSAAQLSALIEGLDWARVHARRVVAPEAVQ